MDEFEFQIINGTVKAVLYSNIENGYSVFRLDDYIVVGYIPEVYPGEKMVVEGQITNHPTYGLQIKAEECTRFLPDDKDSIFVFLSSGAVPGIGNATASLLVNMFGDDTLSVIESDPKRVSEIKGISLKKATQFSDVIKQKTFLRRLNDLLVHYGIRPFIAYRLYKYYGINAYNEIIDNPYIITKPEIGATFAEADHMAIDLGFDTDCSMRIKSASIFELIHNLNNGHCFIPEDSLVSAVSKLISVDSDKVKECLSLMAEDGSIIADHPKDINVYYLPIMYKAETYVANRLISMVDNFEIITGGPGTGKTTSIIKIIDECNRHGLKYFLTAPTGKAAKRMSEVTGQDAQTIHRLLLSKLSEDGESIIFGRNEDYPLDADIVIVDEASMVDILLLEALLKAIPEKCKLIMVGDMDQLPPVGPGNPFKSIINSNLFNSIKLTTIHRQSENSFIIKNAHLINNGQIPDFSLNKGDFFRLKRDGALSSVETITDLFSNRLPQKMNIQINDIQVLTPTKQGELGTYNLNTEIQKTVNPSSPDKKEKMFGKFIFRVGDRVMQVRNNYDILWHNFDYSVMGNGMFNGDVGYITDINNEEEIIEVLFDDKYCEYSYNQLNELELAYAITVHKSQGCEFKAVILALSTSSRLLLTRDVLYTAITRAKDLLILVGDELVAVNMINNNKKSSRYSYLQYRLKQVSL